MKSLEKIKMAQLSYLLRLNVFINLTATSAMCCWKGNDGIFWRCVKWRKMQWKLWVSASPLTAVTIWLPDLRLLKCGIDHWRTQSHETQAGEQVSQGGTELMMRILQALQSREAFKINSPFVTTCNRLGQVLHIVSAETFVQITPF